MPFPPQTTEAAVVSAKILVCDEYRGAPWQGFGSTIFSLSEPEMVERPGDPTGIGKGSLPSQSILMQLMKMAYGECGLTRGRVCPFRYERSSPSTAPSRSALRWNQSDFCRIGADRVMDYIHPAIEHGLTDLWGVYATQDLPQMMRESNGRTLREASYGEYVERVVSLISYWKRAYDIELGGWALFNEPNFPTNLPTALSPEGHVKLTKLLGRALVREGLKTRIVVADDWTIRRNALTIAQAVLGDAEAREFVCAVGYHSYDGYDFAQQDWRDFEKERKAREELSELCREHNVPVWMTEISNYRPADSEWHNTMFRMCQIYDDMVYGEVCAWDFMLAFWQGAWRQNIRGGPQGLAEFYYEPDGSVTRTQLTGTATALGHWSRIVRPGWRQRVVRGAPQDLRVTAFEAPNGQALCLVFLQDSPFPVEVTLGLSPTKRWRPHACGFRSNTIERWGDIGLIPGRGGRYSLTLPRNSATTIIIEAEDC